MQLPNGFGYSLGDNLLVSAHATTNLTMCYVDSVNGSDATGTGTKGQPYATLAHAYSHAGDTGIWYILADNHDETITAALAFTSNAIISGAGRSGIYPTAILRLGHATANIFSVSGKYNHFRNIRFTPAVAACSGHYIGAVASIAETSICISDCVFEQSQANSLDAVEWDTGGISGYVLSKNNRFVNIATAKNANPTGAVYVGSSYQYHSIGDTYDGGLYNWSNGPGAVDAQSPLFSVVEDVTLLNGATLTFTGGGSVYYAATAPITTGSSVIAEF